MSFTPFLVRCVQACRSGAMVALLACSAPWAQAQVHTQALDAGWQFRLADESAAKAHPDVVDWRPATVPGSVQTDLMDAKLIPDPFAADNEGRLQWIGLSDWEYRLDFRLDGGTLQRKHVELVFDGLDTFAQVTLNGQPLASTDNMFRRWRLPAKELLKAGNNTLVVRLQSPIKRMQPWLQKQPYALPGAYDSQFGDEPKGVNSATYVRKAQYHYGWDWGPRFVTLGIWKPVRIESWNTARVEDFHVRQLRVDANVAVLAAELEVDATRTGPAKLQVDVAPPQGQPFTLMQDVVLEPGRNQFSLPIRIERPRRWYPAGYGAQPMYTVRATLTQESEELARAERRTGLRTVELRREKDAWGRSFAFVINGIPVFAKGANMIPLDSFPSRVTRARQRAMLETARRANMNMLRLWGGAYYESDAFYEEADALGILIWQDFMFGGAILPADTVFQENVRQEAVEQVRRLRHHPSIVLWCGNNEVQADWESWDGTLAFKNRLSPDERERLWSANLKLFGDVLRGVVQRYAPDVPYWATSPGVDLEGPSSQMDDGDVHFWRVWGGSAPAETFLNTTPRFMSEYGLQSYPEMRTIAAYAKPEDLRLDSPVIRAHQKFGVAVGPDVGNDRVLFYIRKNYGEPKDFASFVYLSQVMQAEGIELAALHLRSQRPRSMGSLYWQLNDVWPGASWSSVDYFGRWKALQFHARRFYADLTVAALRRESNTNFSVVSDKVDKLNGEVQLRVMDFDGRVLRAERAAVAVKPLGVTTVWERSDEMLLQGADPRRTVAEFELLVAGKSVARQRVYFAPARSLQLADPGFLTDISADPSGGANAFKLSIKSRFLARATWIDFGDIDVELQDNSLDISPGEEVVIPLRSSASLQVLRERLNLRSLAGATLH
ncbi:beta-mannosidase [Roseateles cellulosilyticus]|uniref:Beta-mannosidase B n=1 Tax=Pelomonas cellulosilytica TaxID=2906762 RepID=A0ABS8XSP8_9BURK|nr:glycoside hydrolase family 2 protein [Pelomonas sp. P8]MCE4553917.1 glycoside hydrolase family 2 protein [Pelomonas sp. P8]